MTRDVIRYHLPILFIGYGKRLEWNTNYIFPMHSLRFRHLWSSNWQSHKNWWSLQTTKLEPWVVDAGPGETFMAQEAKKTFVCEFSLWDAHAIFCNEMEMHRPKCPPHSGPLVECFIYLLLYVVQHRCLFHCWTLRDVGGFQFFNGRGWLSITLRHTLNLCYCLLLLLH